MATLSIEDWALRPLTLDAADMVVPDFLIANGGDMYGRGIDLQVTQGGQNATMTGMTVYLFWRHENGNQDMTKATSVSGSTGRFRIYYPPAMLREGGEVLARISIYIGSQKQTGSRNFRIIVEPNPIDDDEAMSDENFSLFLQAVEDLNQLEASVEKAEAARVTAENTRKSNEGTRQSNETKRKEAEADRATAEKERDDAEKARAEAEKTRQGNESTRQKNETTRKQNETGRTSAETSRVEAEETRASEWDALKSRFASSVEASNAATLQAQAAAASVDEAIRNALGSAAGIGDQLKAIDTLARNSCTGGMFVNGSWYVKHEDVAWGGERLAVHGSGLSLGRMLLPTTRCQAARAYETAASALSLAESMASLVEAMSADVEGLQEAVATLARKAGSYPFRIGKSLYVRGVTYAAGRLTVPTASYVDGRMKISAM